MLSPARCELTLTLTLSLTLSLTLTLTLILILTLTLTLTQCSRLRVASSNGDFGGNIDLGTISRYQLSQSLGKAELAELAARFGKSVSQSVSQSLGQAELEELGARFGSISID